MQAIVVALSTLLSNYMIIIELREQLNILENVLAEAISTS